MKLCVLVKEVPDMTRVRFDSERGVVDRSSAPAEINPFDESALQAAVELKQQLGCTVQVFTMGPPRAEASLRDAYARGADACVLLSDRRFSGADTFATARTLAAALQREGDLSLIICGEKSVDGDTAQVGPEVAELLGLPHACYVDQILELTADEVCVRVEDLGGAPQLRRMRLPALVSLTKNAARPLLPLLERKLASLSVEIPVWNADTLSGWVTPEELGSKGSPTKVAAIDIPPAAVRSCRLFRGDQSGFVAAVAAAWRGEDKANGEARG